MGQTSPHGTLKCDITYSLFHLYWDFQTHRYMLFELYFWALFRFPPRSYITTVTKPELRRATHPTVSTPPNAAQAQRDFVFSQWEKSTWWRCEFQPTHTVSYVCVRQRGKKRCLLASVLPFSFLSRHFPTTTTHGSNLLSTLHTIIEFHIGAKHISYSDIFHSQTRRSFNCRHFPSILLFWAGLAPFTFHLTNKRRTATWAECQSRLVGRKKQKTCSFHFQSETDDFRLKLMGTFSELHEANQEVNATLYFFHL